MKIKDLIVNGIFRAILILNVDKQAIEQLKHSHDLAFAHLKEELEKVWKRHFHSFLCLHLNVYFNFLSIYNEILLTTWNEDIFFDALITFRINFDQTF